MRHSALLFAGGGPQGRAAVRFAVVQVWFKSGAHRDYVIGYKVGRGSQGSEPLKPKTYADAGLPALDLRDRKQAARLETAIAAAAKTLGG